MINNDILRRLRYCFNFNDNKMVSIFAQADLTVSREQVSAWLKHEDLDGFDLLEDEQLAYFLNGFINLKRGKKEGAQPVVEKRLSNNAIFRKLRIALDLKDTDILAMMDLADFPLSKHELSAFFRKEGHKNYRACQEQVLRQFLRGMQFHYRPEHEASADKSANSNHSEEESTQSISPKTISTPELRRQQKEAQKRKPSRAKPASKPHKKVSSESTKSNETHKNSSIWNK